jgi:hypothetical protein
MSGATERGRLNRRDFLATVGAAGVLATAAPALLAQPPATATATAPALRKLVGIQVGAVSFIDEGVDQVLDVLQQNQIDTIFLATFTYGRGIAGRQVPGQPLPDHGKQEYDERQFHGGNYATPHAQFYEKTALKQMRAPDHGDVDILELVLPKTKSRGIKVYCWYEDQFARDDIPGIQPLREIELGGRRATTCCPLNPDYRNFLNGLTEDYCTSYDIDGVMWGSERGGPLDNIISRPNDPMRVTCFCDLHQRAAKERGIDPARAVEGYKKLADVVRMAGAKQRPSDGYFVTFWRLLVEYPEILAWENLWTDSKHAIYADIHRAAKAARPNVQVGFHIWHANSFSPFVRAEQDYAKFAKCADYLKIVLYNNCGGPRYARAIDGFANTIFADVPRDEVLSLFNHWLGYGDEATLDELPTKGLSADYVTRETRRAIDDVAGRCRIYPGIDIDIPTDKDQKRTTSEDVYASTTAAFKAGGDGVIFSRKYSEMRLANLAAGGKAVKEWVK